MEMHASCFILFQEKLASTKIFEGSQELNDLKTIDFKDKVSLYTK